MIKKEMILIPENLVVEALEYAIKSKKFTSNRHDFHEGGLDAKQRKMFEGKLGEKIFKMFLLNHEIDFEEDSTSHENADFFDFILVDGTKIDVKTRTKDFHTRTLEMVEQFEKSPKEIYISIRLYPEKKEGFIVGWCTKEDIVSINRVENNGYLDNYVLFDKELRPVKDLLKKLKKHSENDG
jgi:hypothetical protein